MAPTADAPACTECNEHHLNPDAPSAACRHRSNTSRDRGPRAFLEAAGCVVVLFWLSWRLAPICSVSGFKFKRDH